MIVPPSSAFGTRPEAHGINRNSPQARGLVFWWAGPRTCDNVTGVISTQTSRAEVPSSLGGLVAHSPTLGGTGAYVRQFARGDYPTSYTDWSLAVWARVEAFQTSYPYISALLTAHSAGVDALILRLGDSTDTTGTRPQIGCTSYKVMAPSGVAANEWFHLAGTNVGNGVGAGMKLYVNGVLVNTGTSLFSPSLPTPVIELFSDRTWTRAPKGQIADARVWSRELSSEEVWALYDPRTRWELYARPTTKVFVDLGATSQQIQQKLLRFYRRG